MRVVSLDIWFMMLTMIVLVVFHIFDTADAGAGAIHHRYCVSAPTPTHPMIALIVIMA